MIDTERLEDIMQEIENLREEAMGIVSEVRRKDVVAYERAYRGWNSEIETALSKHNEWLGQLTMDTLEETIEVCRELNYSTEDEEKCA
jgi:hypothetical protein